MRFLLRIVGTWLLGMTLILLVMDGTKSLAESTIRMTSIGDIWAMAHESSFMAFEAFFVSDSLNLIWEYSFEPFLSWPGWAVIGVPGLLFVLMGQVKTRRHY